MNRRESVAPIEDDPSPTVWTWLATAVLVASLLWTWILSVWMIQYRRTCDECLGTLVIAFYWVVVQGILAVPSLLGLITLSEQSKRGNRVAKGGLIAFGIHVVSVVAFVALADWFA